jgi:hypothetical protein
MSLPTHVILVPISESDIKRDESFLRTAELFSQANSTIKNRKSQLKNEKCIVKNNAYCFNSEKKGISNLKNELAINGSILYIVGHHHYIGELGREFMRGFTPEQLADKIAHELDDQIANIKCIQFYTCDSAYNYAELNNDSYCNKFYKYMKNKYKTKDLIVGGFIGYLFEDTKHKRTYITPVYNDYSKKFRAEEKIVYFGK